MTQTPKNQQKQDQSAAERFSILSDFSNGWQHLDHPTPQDSEPAERLSSQLQDRLSLLINSQTLIVLAGSGASLGIKASDGEDGEPKQQAPSMRTLWEEITNLPSYANVKDQLSENLVESENLEHVLSDAQMRLHLDDKNDKLRTFINEAEDVVWSKCDFIDQKSDLTAHQLFLRKVARRSTKLQRTQIFTTNYDLAFESAAQGAQFNVIDGFGYGGKVFDGASFDIDYVRRYPHEPLTLEPNVFHLLKLHGSVDWTRTGTSISKTASGEKPENPVLIYPSSAKYQQSYQQPYLELISRFQMALRQPSVGLIVIGFGFNDDHLSAPIEEALRSNVGLRAVFVSPGIKNPGENRTFRNITQLIEAGDRRLMMLDTTFDMLVKILPEVPPHEDWDLHSQRVHSGNLA